MAFCHLNQAFKEPENNYVIVYTAIPPRPDTAKYVGTTEIDPEYFPSKGYYIEHVEVLNEQYDWIFETTLKGKKLSAEVISQFIGRFRELAEDIMNRVAGISGNQKSLQLYPRSAVAGSIQIKFDADNDDAASESLKIVGQIIQAPSEEEFRRKLREYKINPSQLRDFLISISINQLETDITPKVASYGDMLGPFVKTTKRRK